MQPKNTRTLSAKSLQKIASSGLNPQEQKTLRELWENPIRYMPHDSFRRPVLMAKVMRRQVHVVRGKLLTPEAETTLFLQMNYCRYKMRVIERRLQRLSAWPDAALEELLGWNRKQLEVRDAIVNANMGLVLAMGRQRQIPTIEFNEYISEGQLALLNATEKFDCSYGWRFSTYACRAILSSFSHLAGKHSKYVSRFPIQLETKMLKDHDGHGSRKKEHDELLDDVLDIVKHNRADLTRIERSIIEMRFSLRGKRLKPMTLKQVGEVLDLTKERIRQIQSQALSKLRVTVRNTLHTT